MLFSSDKRHQAHRSFQKVTACFFFFKVSFRAGFYERLLCHSLARDAAGNLRLKSS